MSLSPHTIPVLRPRALAALALVVLALAGCGGDGSDSADATATATAPTVTAPTATAPTVTAPTVTAPTATSTIPRQAPQTETERVGDCLRRLGYRLTGGAPQVRDSAAPEYQIVLDGPRGGGYIGFYENRSRAMRVANQLRKNAKRTTGASVERHGSINIVWVDLPDSAARERVRGCLVT